MPEAPQPRTVVGFDFGLRRLGLAAGDTLTRRAAPRAALAMLGHGPDWVAIGRWIEELRPAVLVVGVPYNADGTPGALTAAARNFAAQLRQRFDLPVDAVDERWSSLEASEALKAARARGTRRRRVRREDLDGAAAAVILERWLAGERQDP